MKMLKMIKFFIWMGKESVLKELSGLVRVAEMDAFNNCRRTSDHNDAEHKMFWDGKVRAYSDVLDTINRMMEREKHGYNKES